MDYIKAHHMWKPLAAISSREEVRSGVTVPSSLSKSTAHSTLYRKITTAMASQVAPISPITTLMETENDVVWHRILSGADSNNIFNRINETELNLTEILFNTTMAYGNYSSGNESYYKEVPWQLVTMIGTAVVLGLLILATVIGIRIFAK